MKFEITVQLQDCGSRVTYHHETWDEEKNYGETVCKVHDRIRQMVSEGIQLGDRFNCEWVPPGEIRRIQYRRLPDVHD
jgi:hypothetical protein